MRLALIALLALSGCHEEVAAASVPAADGAALHDPALRERGQARHDPHAYEAALARVEARREALGRRLRAADSGAERAEVRNEARAYALQAMREVIFPAWMGTPWGLGPNSTPTRPHQPDTVIACGYFISSALENLGLRLDTRFRFAQAPALHAQRSLAPARADLHRYFSVPGDRLARDIVALGEGLYIIGLNNHIAFVDVRAGEARLVHASYTDEQVVIDEPLATAQVIANSRTAGYFVTPLLQDERLIDRWLRGEPVALQKLGVDGA